MRSADTCIFRDPYMKKRPIHAHVHTHTSVFMLCTPSYVDHYISGWKQFSIKHTHTHVRTYSRTHTHTHTHTQVHVHTHSHTCTHTSVSMLCTPMSIITSVGGNSNVRVQGKELFTSNEDTAVLLWETQTKFLCQNSILLVCPQVCAFTENSGQS